MGQLDFIHQFLSHLPYYAILLDSNRQIITSNDSFLTDNNLITVNEIFSMGPGDIFQCENAEESGCGNSPNCQFCGIYKTINECVLINSPVDNACKLMVHRDSFIKAFDFIVRCSPINIASEKYYLLTLTDVSAENRKLNLERIFFHDVLNMVSGLNGLSLCMAEINEQPEMQKYISMFSHIANKLCETIASQRDLISAEKNGLVVSFCQILSKDIITSVLENSLFGGNQAAQNIKLSPANSYFTLHTDPVLLSRVLVNMIKNALEAPNWLPDITLGCAEKNGKVRFFVHNHAYIDEPQSKRIFQPMCSTKDDNRGLGTYSMRLIGENYLKGKVFFTTHPQHGTTFTIEIPTHI